MPPPTPGSETQKKPRQNRVNTLPFNDDLEKIQAVCFTVQHFFSFEKESMILYFLQKYPFFYVSKIRRINVLKLQNKHGNNHNSKY